MVLCHPAQGIPMGPEIWYEGSGGSVNCHDCGGGSGGHENYCCHHSLDAKFLDPGGVLWAEWHSPVCQLRWYAWPSQCTMSLCSHIRCVGLGCCLTSHLWTNPIYPPYVGSGLRTNPPCWIWPADQLCATHPVHGARRLNIIVLNDRGWSSRSHP